MDDHALLERAKKDPEAIGEIYDLYAEKLYGFLMKRCKHKETAEDLVAKVFTKFIEAVPTFEWRGFSLGAWLYRAASNALIDHWRSASQRMDTQIDEDWEPPSKEKDPSWYAEQTLDREKIQEVMKGLSPRDQEVLDLHFFGGFETPEIAEVLQVTPNHASVLVYRALGRLRTKYVRVMSNV
ncbi:sigma-70 family RNA polymerase sigma factor [Candidatus Uhrbacteria bacterium]|nr:sigma-70 family RNA polymerase sigma factor [Candidatus Uhrbacteria bacterium]